MNSAKREREIIKRIDLLESKPKETKLEEAESTIDKFFETYPDGHRWIKNTHESGRARFYAPNLFGGRRHLFGYISAYYGVQSAMDRRGPNSLIQGPLSQVGYVAVYLLERWLDDLTRETKLPLIDGIGVFNMVHDSQEMEARTLWMPLASYMLEHSATTMIVEYFEKNKIPLNVEFEVDQEIGANLADTIKFDGHRNSMERSMLPLATSKRERRMLQDNINIIMALREKEVERDLRDYEKDGLKPSKRRLLTAKHVLQMHVPLELRKAKHLI